MKEEEEESHHLSSIIANFLNCKKFKKNYNNKINKIKNSPIKFYHRFGSNNCTIEFGGHDFPVIGQ